MNSLVSVIVPVYNKEDVLSRCLNSIKNQSYTYFEVLLVNDGSKDKSLPILKQYERFKFEKADLGDKDKLEQIFEDNRFDIEVYTDELHLSLTLFSPKEMQSVTVSLY